MDLYTALSRLGPASRGVDGVFRGLGAVLTARIRSCRDPSGNFGDEQRTAQALSALDRLRAWPAASETARSVAYLLEAQRVDGSRRSSLVWQGPPSPNPPSVGFASEALITAYCMESLARFVRRSAVA